MVWEEGHFPLWRPTIMSGTPFAANPLAGLYYPPNWPLLFLPWLPLEVGVNLSALFHLWLAGAAMYMLMRQGLHAGGWGALVAAVTYQGSPKLLAHLGAGHVGWVQAWAWLPLLILCVFNASPASRRPWRWTVAAGLVLAIQFLADVRMSAYTLAAASGFIFVRLTSRIVREVKSRERTNFQSLWAQLRDLRFPLTALAVFAGLSACQWFPAVALLPETTRSAMTLQDAAVWSLPGRYFIGLLLADHGGFHEWMTYLGIGTLVFACVGVRSLWHAQGRQCETSTFPRPGWLSVWLVGLVVFSSWFSLGRNGGLFQVLWRIVPGLGLLRVPPRAWVLITFGAAVLAGLGVEEILGRECGRMRAVSHWRRALAIGVTIFPAMLLIGYWLVVGGPPPNLAVFGLITPLILGLCTTRFLRRRRRLLGFAAVFLVALDLLVVDGTLIEARSPDRVFEQGRAAAEWLADQPEPFRVYSPSYSIPQHVAERHRLELADGVDPLQLRVYANYLTRAAGLDSLRGYSVTLPPYPEGSDVRTALAGVCPDAEALGRLGVRYAAAAFPLDCGQQAANNGWQLVDRVDETYIYHNKDAKPVPDTESDMTIMLADGPELFRYDPRPVYAGWGISGVTVVGLAVWAAVRSGPWGIDD
jgi:hypothetical protein